MEKSTQSFPKTLRRLMEEQEVSQRELHGRHRVVAQAMHDRDRYVFAVTEAANR